MERQTTKMQYDKDGDKILGEVILTELEKQEAERAKQLQRLNMIKKQNGFKGEHAFISKPEKIEFIDFAVGKTHSLIFNLTNVSNAFNSFNVIPLPQKIRNFFEIEYTPKGKISPGISCDLKFKFTPQLDEDIASQFSILAETGKISFPIRCVSRKTIIRCDHPTVNFANIVFGGQGKASLTVRNEGHLPSSIMFLHQDETPLPNNLADSPDALIRSLLFDRKIEVKGYSEKIIDFVAKPNQIGKMSTNLLLYVVNSMHSPSIPVSLLAECVEVPVQIQQQVYDFRICLLGQIYRQKLSFSNSGDLPMSFKMQQSAESRKYFEFNPSIGYIQKQSKIDVWVKFSAEKDLTLYLSKHQDKEGVFAVPFSMVVKEQIRPVSFALTFSTTSEKVTIRPAELNFGTIFQGLSSKIELELQNESDLPQELLFQTEKSQLTLKHNQPLIKLLPREKVKTHVVYSSRKTQQTKMPFKEEGALTCQIITGQIGVAELRLDYACEIIRPALTILNNKIELPALQINQVTHICTSLRNTTNKEIIYEIFVPHFDICGLKVTPVVKTLVPKQEVQLNIQFHSFMKKLNIATMQKINGVQETKTTVVEEVIAKKQTKKQTKLTKQQLQQLQIEQKKLQEEQKIQKQKEEQSRLQMERNFDSTTELAKMGGTFYQFQEAQHYQWLLPIYFKQKNFPDGSAQINFIEITTTSIEQILSCDKTEIYFGQIAVGTRFVKQLIISNKGEDALLRMRNLPVFCSYSVLNSLKEVTNTKPFRAIIQFQPIEEQKFQQKLQFYTQKYTISCMLKGRGVRPQVLIEPQNGIVNFGGVLLDEYSQRILKIKNVCNFQIQFKMQSVGCGMLNTNSSKPITYTPSYGSIVGNGTVDIKVKFRPDRLGEKFYQKVKVHVEQQKTVSYFYITGSCYQRQAYVSDFKDAEIPSDKLSKSKVEYPFDFLRLKDEEMVYGPLKKTIILEFKKGTGDEKCSKQKLMIGSCKLLDSKAQKAVNYEVVMAKDDRFQCENAKGSVTSGLEQVISFSFKAQEMDPFIARIPVLAGVGQWRQVKAQLKLSGGFVKPGGIDAVSLQIILRAYVNQI